MRSVAVFILLAVVMLADAKELATKGAIDASDSTDKLASNLADKPAFHDSLSRLADRAIKEPLVHGANLDMATLGKRGNFAITLREGLKPLSHLRIHPYSIPGESTSRWAGYQRQSQRQMTAAVTEEHAARHSPSALVRRPFLLAGALSALTSGMPPTFAIPEAPGSWARHRGPFIETDFAGLQKTASGLEYRVIEDGSGDKPKKAQNIKAHYSGYLLNGDKFDSSYDRGSPLPFAVGVGRVIKGWDEALLDMKVGEKRLLKIPSDLAYGSRGAGGAIPPDSTLVFYVELVSLGPMP